MEKRVINMRNLLKIMYPNTPQLWDKSGTTPSAQADTLCDPGNDYNKIYTGLEAIFKEKGNHQPILTAVLELMMLNGLRISEVLSISGKDITAQGQIFIKGKKGSSDRWVVAGQFRNFWIGLRNKKDKIGDTYSRFYFYREFKKIGITITKGHGSNAAVTHAFRHMVATSQLKTVDNLENTAKFLGHKSTKSTKHYDRRKKE